MTVPVPDADAIMRSSVAWSIDGADGCPILGNTHIPSQDCEPRGIVLIAHGFKGYKDYGFVPYLAQQLALRGLITLRYNFSHSGMTNDLARYTRPDLFERDTWSKQITDQLAVARAVRAGILVDAQLADRLPMYWFGHSRGGITSILAADRAFEQSPDIAPDAVISASAPATSCTLHETQKRRLRRDGFLDTKVALNAAMLRIGLPWLEEMETDPQAYDPLRAAAVIPCPVLILHGDIDQTVSLKAARAYEAAAGRRGKLAVIRLGNHVFNTRHPLNANKSIPEPLTQLIDKTAHFIEELEQLPGNGNMHLHQASPTHREPS